MKSSLLILFSSFLTVFMACNTPDGQIFEIGEQNQSIVGGQVAVQGQFPAVGALAFQAESGQFIVFCTGTLIAPDIVLTAAHCIDAEEFGLENQNQVTGFVQVIFDTVEAEVEQNIVRRAAETIPSFKFDGQRLGFGNDVGIIILEDPVVGIEPLPFNQNPVDDLVGQKFTAVGYGITDDSANDGGTQRFVELTLVDFDNELIFYGEENANVCNGDSGGPDIMNINGVDTVIGIHSFVFGNQNGEFCRSLSASQRPDTQIQFIEDAIAGNIALCEADFVCELGCGEFDPDCGPGIALDDINDINAGGCSINTSSNSSNSFGFLFLLIALGYCFTRRFRQ